MVIIGGLSGFLIGESLRVGFGKVRGGRLRFFLFGKAGEHYKL